MDSKKTQYLDQLAKACAIHFAMQNNTIAYDEAKLRVQPILQVMNDHLEQITTDLKQYDILDFRIYEGTCN